MVHGGKAGLFNRTIDIGSWSEKSVLLRFGGYELLSVDVEDEDVPGRETSDVPRDERARLR